MEEDILAMILAFAASMALLGCLTAVALTMIKRRSFRSSELDIGRRLDEIADRLSRIDGAVDTMAVEVERISEAQRFTARVLADRTGPGAGAIADKSRVGSTTPH
jgi:hypothetical protein